MSRFTRLDLSEDLSWVPADFRRDAQGNVPLDTQTYIESYLADPSEWHWSTHDEPREIKLKRVMAILAKARLPEHAKAVAQLGVGPFEDMMSDWLLDRLEAYLPFDVALYTALSGLYVFNEPPAVQDRLARMMAASERARKK
ncbi:hypothetical protein [Mesorhizobium sp. B2-3-12]|uniref:hypothetical protein n=1 Tax=Mesorhizobium sp. B2-3-12 TaxID=2589952 RepID=UPI001FF009DF|nr:hypothetical protein [Mesorhizobium sp. B2-3-12]